MIRSARIFILILMVAFIVESVFGCSRLLGPADTDIVKAVQNSDLFNTGFITLKSPVTILEKMSRGKDGAWPVKVKATVSFKANRELSIKSDRQKKAGPVEVTEEKTLIFKLHKVVDNAGNTIWKADIAG
jgi:hypothetical protein